MFSLVLYMFEIFHKNILKRPSKPGAYKMTQGLKALAAKPDDLSFILGIQAVGRERQLQEVVL